MPFPARIERLNFGPLRIIFPFVKPQHPPLASRLRPVWVAVACTLTLAHCAPSYTLVNHTESEEIRHETFLYRKWVASSTEPETVIVGLHGFSGASIDYENLALHLLRHQPRTALYAYEIRGQGRDPKKDRRGDIDDPALWCRDLLKFTELVKNEHPDAEIVWFGESMGALIVARTYQRQIARDEDPPCDAIAFSSPVVGIRDDFPAWKRSLVRGLAKFAPTARVSLKDLAGGEDVPMTGSSVYADQSETNSWHVESHTLRLLATLGDMIEYMPKYAEAIEVPTLVLHGGRDFFSQKKDIDEFVSHLENAPAVTREFYPGGHHLLMYDHVKDQVVCDIAAWTARLAP